jgi:DNA modification methylase
MLCQVNNSESEISQGAFCLHCSAWRGSLGLEPTIDLYLSHLVAIFREIRRVLRKDGTCWVNIGDSYAGSWSGNSMRPDGGTQRPGRPGFQPLDERVPARSGVVPRGLKPKDLCLIPFRLALALQADGWWVRSDIIFSKKNPMPESVTDRPTRSHEYLFLLSKNARYYYDQEAIRELSTSPEQEAHNQRYARVYDISDARSEFRQPGNVNSKGIHARPGPGGRNIRSVWTIPTAPYPGAHFATFPPDLVRPCILAGSAKRGIVLDPFCGSGTVGLVCRELDRHFIGLDLSFPYLRDQAMPRVEWKAPDVKMEGLPLFDNPKER